MARHTQEKYLQNKTLSQVEKKRGDSQFWTGLMEVKDHFLVRGPFLIHSGHQVSFWEDLSMDDKPFKVHFPSHYKPNDEFIIHRNFQKSWLAGALAAFSFPSLSPSPFPLFSSSADLGRRARAAGGGSDRCGDRGRRPARRRGTATRRGGAVAAEMRGGGGVVRPRRAARWGLLAGRPAAGISCSFFSFFLFKIFYLSFFIFGCKKFSLEFFSIYFVKLSLSIFFLLIFSISPNFFLEIFLSVQIFP